MRPFVNVLAERTGPCSADFTKMPNYDIPWSVTRLRNKVVIMARDAVHSRRWAVVNACGLLHNGTMGEPDATKRVDRLLRPAYPENRQRVHIIRWLGWIAHRVPDRREFTRQDVATEYRGTKPWQDLTPMFDDAVEHGLLSRYKTGYRFEDSAVQADLAAAYEKMSAGVTGTVIALVAANKARLIMDGIACYYVVAAQELATLGHLSGVPWPSNLFVGILQFVYSPVLFFVVGTFGLQGPFAFAGICAGAWVAAELARWLAAGPALTRAHRVRWGLAVVVAVGGITVLFGVARTVPAALVAACGLLVCVLTTRLAKTPRTRWWKHLLKPPLVDIIAIATASATFLVLSVKDLLTTQPAAGFLFPLAVWGSVRVWRAMRASDRLPIRAAADLTLSLLFGVVFVVFLVWLANVVGISRPEMAVLRVALERFGAVADLPWWVWTVLYTLLAALYLAFLYRPERMAKLIHRLRRLHVLPVANGSRRVLTGVHFGLLGIVLVGLAAPVTLTVTLQRQLAAAYAVAVQRTFEADGELLAYQQIRQQLSTEGAGSSQPLTNMFRAVPSDGSPALGRDDTQSVESYDAKAFGRLQAATLSLTGTRLLLAAEQTAVRAAGFDAPLRDAADADDRIEQVEADQTEADTADHNAEVAGDLAAKALAGLVSVPGLRDGFQLAQEYLSGLVEESPLKDEFADWALRLTGATVPPSAKSIVVPDAGRLKQAALADLSGQLDAKVVAEAKTEPPLKSATDLIDGTRQLQAGSDGDCSGCGSSGGSGGQDDEAPGDPPPVVDEGG